MNWKIYYGTYHRKFVEYRPKQKRSEKVEKTNKTRQVLLDIAGAAAAVNIPCKKVCIMECFHECLGYS